MKKILLLTIISFLFLSKSHANNWMTSLEDAKKMAIVTNKFILVDFWATWCGPCKRMDSESWSDKEVQSVMSNFIPVKIDIDMEQSISRKYSVRGIPFIFILDPNGEIVYKKMSYMNKSQVLVFLKNFSLNTEFFHSQYAEYSKNENGDLALKLAEKYYDYAIYQDKKIRNNFLTLGKTYFKKAKNLYKEEGNKNKQAQRLLLLNEVYRNMLYNKNEKALKNIEKDFVESNIEEQNKALYNFLNFTLYNKLGKKEDAKDWYAKLKKDKDAKLYLLKSRKILSL